jgi:polar amino acid transport system permease protein
VTDFSLLELLLPMLAAARWTIWLSLIAFGGGGAVGIIVMLSRLNSHPIPRALGRLFVELFQGTPLLIQLFLCFFGLPIVGLEPSEFVAASIALVLFSAAYLGEIWRGCVESVPRGQWDASASLALSRRHQMIYVIVPQAVRVALAPTAGFAVQIVKGTSLAAIVGFQELTRVGMTLSNATFQPFLIYGLIGVIYFGLCMPLSMLSRHLEGRFGTPAPH